MNMASDSLSLNIPFNRTIVELKYMYVLTSWIQTPILLIVLS